MLTRRCQPADIPRWTTLDEMDADISLDNMELSPLVLASLLPIDEDPPEASTDNQRPETELNEDGNPTTDETMMELAQLDLWALGTTRLGDTKLRAIDDAAYMQDAIARECATSNTPIPPYRLTELIGRGTFGRVYKAIPLAAVAAAAPIDPDLTPRPNRPSSPLAAPPKTVAIKIMSIEEGDLSAPGSSDTFCDILREVETLKMLRHAGAQNVNTVLDALLVGQTMWMITEYCAGGSVTTLMKPTGCLAEEWIIPILRGVASGLFWVHQQGVVHRDIKCANVLVTDEGAVQICDFGVAGVLRGQFEKRNTVTGTLQWMAPELFDERVSYGKEVDVWAFGSMAIEVATGMPPNAAEAKGIDFEDFGEFLRRNSPRLEGEGYSEGLKDLVRFCMVPDPAERPRAEEIQRHGYIFGTEETHPTEMLAELVRRYRKWERTGGDRMSLFDAEGGARGLAGDQGEPGADEGWDYGTVNEADQMIYNRAMENVDTVPEQAARPKPMARRRRRMPPVDLGIRAIRPPLEKAFDPNTISNYRDHARDFYGSNTPRPSQHDDTIRESPVRTSLPNSEDVFPSLPDQETIKPASRSNSYDKTISLFGTNRTQDWTFPAMPSASGDPDVVISTAPESSNGLFITTPDSENGGVCDSNPTRQRTVSSRVSTMSLMSLIDLDASLPTPMGEAGLPLISPMTMDPAAATRSHNSFDAAFSCAPNPTKQRNISARVSCMSLIDLDASLPTPIEEAGLSMISPMSMEPATVAPATAIRHGNTFEAAFSTAFATITPPADTEDQEYLPGKYREPSLYISFADECSSGDESVPRVPRIVLGSRTISDESASGASVQSSATRANYMPLLPLPPSEEVILGLGSKEMLREEVQRMLLSMRDHLQCSSDMMARMPVRRAV